MPWLASIFLLCLCGLGVYLWTRRNTIPETRRPVDDRENHAALWAVLEQAVARYEKEQLSYTLWAKVRSGAYSTSFLRHLEDNYTKVEACPWLSLPKEWQAASAAGIRAWMITHNLPFSDELPALHQLELLLEKRAQEKANTILKSENKAG